MRQKNANLNTIQTSKNYSDDQLNMFFLPQRNNLNNNIYEENKPNFAKAREPTKYYDKGNKKLKNNNINQYQATIYNKKAHSLNLDELDGINSSTSLIASNETNNFISFLNGLEEELVDYIRTQKGSRNLQKFLNNISSESIKLIFIKLNNRFTELLVDIYGNYFIQKIVTYCTLEQRVYLLQCVMIN